MVASFQGNERDEGLAQAPVFKLHGTREYCDAGADCMKRCVGFRHHESEEDYAGVAE